MRKTYQNSDYQQHLAEQSGQQGETFSLHPEHLEMPREQASREVRVFFKHDSRKTLIWFWKHDTQSLLLFDYLVPKSCVQVSLI